MAELKMSLLSEKIQFKRLKSVSQLKWVKRQLDYSGESEEKQKEYLRGKKINNYRG